MAIFGLGNFSGQSVQLLMSGYNSTVAITIVDEWINQIWTISN